jgi:hypothetical protein
MIKTKIKQQRRWNGQHLVNDFTVAATASAHWHS